MKVIHALSGLCLLAFLLLFGVASINESVVNNEWLSALAETSISDDVMIMRIGTVVLALTLVYLISFMKPRSKDKTLQFNTENGSVQVSLSAAADYLSKLKKEFAAVVSLTPKLSARGQGVVVLIKTGIRSGTRIPELSNLIQQRVRECLQQDLGLENVADIKISISEISGAPPVHDDYQPIINMGKEEGEEKNSEA